MKSYKSYNIETGEPSDFSPIVRGLGVAVLSFLVRPFLYSLILGLSGVSVSFWLAFSILLIGKYLYTVPIGTKLQKAFNNVAQAKELNQRYSTISYAVVSLLVTTMIGYLTLLVLGVEAPILTVLAAHVAVDFSAFLMRTFFQSIAKSPNSTTAE